MAGQDRLNRSGSGCFLSLSSSKVTKIFSTSAFPATIPSSTARQGWSNSPHFRGDLSVSCSSYRGTLLLPPWLRWLGESERCDHAAGPEVTPSWELQYSCISPTWWLRPPTPRYNYLSLLSTHHTLHWPGRLRLRLILSVKVAGVQDGLTTRRTSAEKMSEKYPAIFCKLLSQVKYCIYFAKLAGIKNSRKCRHFLFDQIYWHLRRQRTALGVVLSGRFTVVWNIILLNNIG